MTMSQEAYEKWNTKKAIERRIRKMAKDNYFKVSKSRKDGLWYISNISSESKNTPDHGMTQKEIYEWIKANGFKHYPTTY